MMPASTLPKKGGEGGKSQNTIPWKSQKI